MVIREPHADSGMEDFGYKESLDRSIGKFASFAAGVSYISILTGTFDYGFATALSYKDVRLCVDEAEALGVPMIAGAAIRQMLAVTNAKYGPDSDFTSIAKVIEEWAGVEIRSKKS